MLHTPWTNKKKTFSLCGKEVLPNISNNGNIRNTGKMQWNDAINLFLQQDLLNNYYVRGNMLGSLKVLWSLPPKVFSVIGK